MDILTTILNPGVLFFILGFAAIMVNSNLSIPESVVKFVSSPWTRSADCPKRWMDRYEIVA